MSDAVLAVFTPGGMSVAGVVALGVLAGVLPLRGGTGQHAGAGPGVLTVWQLSDTAREAPGSDLEEIVWPTVDADPPDDVSDWAEAMLAPRPRRSRRLLEPFELWAPGDESEYVGRHRLVNPLEELRLDIVFQPP